MSSSTIPPITPSTSPRRIIEQASVPPAQAGKRLDQVAAELFPDYSRARLQGWIKGGSLTVDNTPARPRDKVQAGALLNLSAEVAAVSPWAGQAIALDIRFEDADIIVLNKPADLVVHPAAGHPDGTLVNALLHHQPDLALLPRAGIVHRLDRATTGLMVVAKSLRAHADLVRQLQARSVKREYLAVCGGALTGGGTVDAPIGRHPRSRKRMAVVAGGRPAVTHYRLGERFGNHTAVQVQLETGRTHQIRVHFAHIRHPLLGDPLYGGRPRPPRGAAPELADSLRRFPRQALHARALGLTHPATGEPCQWQVENPPDLDALLATLRKHDPVV